MTQEAPRATSPRAWEARPGPMVTFLAAEPGAIRTDTNGVQWWLDARHGWQPVVHDPGRAQPDRELEAGR